MTGQSTGSGGREITFSFFGQGRFMGRDQRAEGNVRRRRVRG